MPLALAAVTALGSADFVRAAGQKRVLVLYSTRRDAQIAINVDRELPRILEDGLTANLDYYSEYLDVGRFPEPAYQPAFRDFLRLKYAGQRFDAVIPVGDASVEFVAAFRDVFPDTPLVFFATNPALPRPANATGVVVEQNLADTLSMAVALQPDARQAFVITGADSGDKVIERLAREQFRPFESRLTITYLSGLPTRELEARLAALPERSIVYYLLFSRDADGRQFHPLAYVDQVAAVARAPVYCWVDSAMDHGIVGGVLKDQTAQATAIATLALRVLRGERADSIPIAQPNLNVIEVDWRQLQRWRLDAARLPAGTVILFREPTVWQRYRIYIVGAAALLAAQTMLIGGLLVQRRRRRLAEQAARGSRAALRTSYERIRALGARLLSAQETERSRIARELHDDICQQAAVLAMDLDLLDGGLRDQSDAELERIAHQASQRAQDLAKSVHDIAYKLHPEKLRLLGLVAAIDSLQRELERPDIAITFSHDDVAASLSDDVTLCLFRVAQEALQNAVKHSRARNVAVRLRRSEAGVLLTITDDGVGFDLDAAPGEGLGLVSMTERLESIGGALKILSKPGEGTRLEIAVPSRSVEALV
jgi:signal transduction histidine kinase